MGRGFSPAKSRYSLHMLGALQLIASKQGDPAESGAGGMEGETDAAAGGGSIRIFQQEASFAGREEVIRKVGRWGEGDRFARLSTADGGVFWIPRGNVLYWRLYPIFPIDLRGNFDSHPHSLSLDAPFLSRPNAFANQAGGRGGPDAHPTGTLTGEDPVAIRVDVVECGDRQVEMHPLNGGIAR